MKPVTDPALLAQLNQLPNIDDPVPGLDLSTYEPTSPKTGYVGPEMGVKPADMTLTDEFGQPIGVPASMGPKPVQDPAILAQLNSAPAEQAPQSPQVSKIDSVLAGANDALSFGLNDELSGLGHALADKIRGKPSGNLISSGIDRARNEQKQAEQSNPGSYLGGQIGGAILPAFTSGGSALAGWAGRGALGARVAKSSALGALSGGAYGAGSAEGDLSDRALASLPSAAIGGVAGGVLPVAGAALRGAKEAVSPAISESGAQIARLAKKYDIPLGLDDLTDSTSYKTLISEGRTLPFANSQAKVAEQMGKFTKAVSRSIGADTDKLTPDVINERFKTVGGEIGNFLKGKNINVGNDFGGKVNDFVADNADAYIGDAKKTFLKYVKDIKTVTNEGSGMALGDDLEKIRKRAVTAKRSKNQELAQIGGDIENFILDVAQGAEGIDDAAIQAFKKAKHQYRNLIAIEPLAAKDQINGGIAPAQLLNRVRQVYGRSFSKGEAGELGDLANIGQYIKDPIANSGTSQRTLARNVLTGSAGTGITAGAYALGGPIGLALQALATGGGLAANRALQARNMSPARMESALKQLSRETKPLKLTVRPSDKRISQ